MNKFVEDPETIRMMDKINNDFFFFWIPTILVGAGLIAAFNKWRRWKKREEIFDRVLKGQTWPRPQRRSAID